MSGKLVGWAMDISPCFQLSASERLVLWTIARFSDEACLCAVSVWKVSQVSGFSQQTVIRACRRLEERELLFRYRRFRSFPRTGEDVFLVNYPRFSADEAERYVSQMCTVGSESGV